MLKRLAINSALSAATCLVSTSALAMTDTARQIDIPRGYLADEFPELARQTGMQFLFSLEQLKGIRTDGVHGTCTTLEAVTSLLQGTRFHFRVNKTGVFRIYDDIGGDGSSNVSALTGSKAHVVSKTCQSSSKIVRLAQAPASSFSEVSNSSRDIGTDESSVSSRDAGSGGSQIGEIIVTAEKRSERLMDVPVPVTALDAQSLTNANQLRIQDYFTEVPGLAVSPNGGITGQGLTLRGIGPGGGNPTVGITIDDVPFGASTLSGSGAVQLVPDIDPSDLQRIEVLAGPQGTLYGASSMGGLFKFVTRDPSTDALTERVQASTYGIANGDGLGYSVRASANVPLSETWAMRVSGFTREDPGYIENIQTGAQGANKQEVDGGHLSAMWTPSRTFSLKLGALYQESKSNSFTTADTRLGDLQQDFIRGTGESNTRSQVYSAVLTSKLGNVALTAITGYNISSFSDVLDYTPYAAGLPPFAAGGASLPEHNKTEKFTQELRLDMPLGQKVDWLLGAFYTYESSHYGQAGYAIEPTTGASVGQGFTGHFDPRFTEIAGFTDVTFHLTDRFDVQLGGRESNIRESYSETDEGFWVPDFYGTASPKIVPETDTKNNVFTYLATPRFKFTEDIMVYARLASGYRAGGPNIGGGSGGVPATYAPDKTQTEEIGLKGEFLDRTLSIDMSLYHIAWKDQQLSAFTVLPSGYVVYTVNAGATRSQGLEIKLEWRPVSSLKIAAWTAWNDTVLTKPLPSYISTNSVSGDHVANGTGPFSGHLLAEQHFPIAKNVTGFVSASLDYVGNRVVAPYSGPPPFPKPLKDYTDLDILSGATFGTYTAHLYANNVANRRGILSQAAFPSTFYVTYIQPRTIGISLAKNF